MNRYTAILLILLTTITIPLFGQKNHELSAQYCLVTSPELFDYSSKLTSDIMGNSQQRENIRWSGGYYGSYRYFFKEIMSISAVLGYNRIWSDLVFNGDVYGESIRDFYTVAVEWNLHYLRLEKFQVYSGCGLGATFSYEDNSYYQNIGERSSKSKGYPNFNFTMAGLRFGGDLAVFTELGMGYKGFFAFGLSLQF